MNNLTRNLSLAACLLTLIAAPLLTPAHAQDDPPEPAAVEGDAPEDDIALPNTGPQRAGAHEPTAEERNFVKATSTALLAQNGKALVPIVIAEKAGPATRKYVAELLEYLNRITGATFAVQTPSGKVLDFAPYSGPRKNAAQLKAERDAQDKLDAANALKPAEPLPQTGIILGTQAEFAVPMLRNALAVHGGFDGKEAYAIRTGPKAVLLLSATERGVHHAVYRFLDALGCRWFATGEHWEVIPRTSNLSFNFDITDRPTIAARNIAFMDGAMSKEVVNGKVYNEREAIADWVRRNSLGSGVSGSVAHSWHRIAEAYNDVLLEHPEYFAEVGGKRQQPVYTDRVGKKRINGVFAKFELGNPVVRKMFVDYALNYFRQNPDADMVPMSPTDGGGFSSSEESRKLGDVSDAVYGLVNEVARAVNKEFPGKMVGIYAYREIAGPPSFPLEPNVYVELATLFNLSKYSNAQLIELWPQKTQNFGLYTYFSYYDADGSGIPGGPVSSISYVKSAIPDFAARNALIVTAQSSNAWGPHMRGYYLAAKLLWNPKADADAILGDFYEKAYGPAATVMKRYHERIERGAGAIITDNLLGAAFRDVDEASRLAKDRPDVLARLGDIKQYLRWIHLCRIVNSTPRRTPEERVKLREVYVKMMQHAVAMRHTYMAQWNMIADRGGRAIAAAVGDISYIIKSKRTNAKFAKIPGDRTAPNTWDGFTEATPASIEADFQESLKQLPARELPQLKFNTDDLVPVVFPASPGLTPPKTAPGADPAVKNEYYQAGSPTYVVYSFDGEPIELEIQGGVRIKTRTTTWSLRQPDGKGGAPIVLKGEVPNDLSWVPVSIKVPAKGQYRLAVNAQNSGARVKYRSDRPMSILWGETGSGAKDYGPPVFYVPKGTAEIVYYFQSNNGAGNTFVQPDGKKVTIANGMNTIPVPEGMDGKVWGMTANSRFRIQRFFNIPNVAAPSVEALMVPREIAQKDGLTIRMK